MSPIRYVTRDSPAVLSIHGSNDRLVPLEQSQRLHQKLRDAGISQTLVPIAGGEHGGYWTAWTPAQLPDVERAVMGFLTEQLQR